MKKFLVPLATAIAALVSQQGLAADTNNPAQSSPTAVTINRSHAIVAFKPILSEPASNLILVKAKSESMGTGWQARHRSHRSHGSHGSHRSSR